MKKVKVQILVSKELNEKIHKAAKALESSNADYIRQAILEKLKREQE